MSKRQLAIDLAGVVGFALIVAGAWLVYRPAALILAGGLLLTFAVLVRSP